MFNDTYVFMALNDQFTKYVYGVKSQIKRLDQTR